MARNASLYDQVVSISSDYLGPTADRFMRRQISTHLGKEPDQLKKEDLVALIDWVKLTFALLTDDAEVIETFSDRLHALARAPAGKRHHG